MPVDIVLGLQWGDEGKGKLVDMLSPSYDIVARFQGGPNAGHTIYYQNHKVILHQIPSGVFHTGVQCLIGNGVVLNPVQLLKEIRHLEALGIRVQEQLYISRRAHLLLPTHPLLDAVHEARRGKRKIGSTLRGIGPAYQDKYARYGIRVGDIFSPDFGELFQYHTEMHNESLKQLGKPPLELEEARTYLDAIEVLKQYHISDTEWLIQQALREGKLILAEGAQGTLLDIDFGSYPYVTSSTTTAAGACQGLGCAPRQIRRVIGVLKAYTTRVGNGPFPTELMDADGERLKTAGQEFGSTTGRPRRCGWLDLPALRYACMLNGITDLALTKADVLTDIDPVSICTHYLQRGERIDSVPYNMVDIQPQYQHFQGWHAHETLYQSVAFRCFLGFLEQELEVPCSFISYGPDRDQVITGEALQSTLQGS